MPDEYPPTDDATPFRPSRVVDPRDATTRRWRCKACGALNDPPPIAQPLERGAAALEPVLPPDLGPFFVKGASKRQLAETERIPEAPLEE